MCCFAAEVHQAVPAIALHSGMLLHVSACYSHLSQVSVLVDDPQADKLVLVMEYAEAGPIMRGDHSINKIPLAEGVALKFFRDVLQVGQAMSCSHHCHVCLACAMSAVFDATAPCVQLSFSLASPLSS